jgi:hypothetical protein
MGRVMVTPRPDAGASTMLIDPEHAEAWRSTLVADLDHPFFFDHPLDHIPGIMLITALLELLRAAVAADGRKAELADRHQISTTLWFPQFCELGEPTELRVVRPSDPNGCWAVHASQAGGAVCHGWVRYITTGDSMDRPAVPPATKPRQERADGAFVHRVRQENILVGPVSEADDGALRSAVLGSPAEDHFFARRGGGQYHPEELIEAARQVAVLRWTYEHGWPTDARLSLNRLRAQLPTTIARDSLLELRWRASPLLGAKARTHLDLHGSGGPEPLGRFDIETQAWTESQWQQLRTRSR